MSVRVPLSETAFFSLSDTTFLYEAVLSVIVYPLAKIMPGQPISPLKTLASTVTVSTQTILPPTDRRMKSFDHDPPAFLKAPPAAFSEGIVRKFLFACLL